MSIRLSYEYVKDKFEEAGYELLGTEYVNNGTKMLCKCGKGHLQYKTLKGVNQKQECIFCLGKDILLNK